LPRVLKGESVPINISDEKAMALEMATGKHIESGYYLASLTKEGLKLSPADPFTDTPLSQGSGIVLTKEDLQKELTVGYQMAGGKLSDVYQLETKGDTEIGGKPTLKREVVHDGEVLSKEEVQRDKKVVDVGVRMDGLVTQKILEDKGVNVPEWIPIFGGKTYGDASWAYHAATLGYAAKVVGEVSGFMNAFSRWRSAGRNVGKEIPEAGEKARVPRASTSIPKSEVPKQPDLWAPDNRRSIYEYLSEKD
jgi:hypothetical protein